MSDQPKEFTELKAFSPPDITISLSFTPEEFSILNERIQGIINELKVMRGDVRTPFLPAA